MKQAKFTLVAVLLGESFAADAQVHRCIDAAGKSSFSDVACPNSAKKSERLMGSSATEKRWEPEGYRAQEQMDSINRARGLQQEAIDTVTRQSQGEDGPVAIGQRSNPAPLQASGERDSEPCETYSNRKGCYGGARGSNPNWSPKRGYYGNGGPADKQYEQEQARAREIAAAKAASSGPVRVTNCNAGGCWDASGNRYNRTGDGQNFWRSDGRFCRSVGNTISCN